MTLTSRLLSLSPGMFLAIWASALAWLWVAPGLLPLVVLVFAVYGLPLVAYRLHDAVFPLREGQSTLIGGAYSPWWGGHQLQAVYLAFPTIEMPLRLVPGLYSTWLRAWGSRIGRGVYWTPIVEVVDRGLLDVGDGAVIGHRVEIVSHLIRPARGNLVLLVRRVSIGAGCFVGAGSVLLPGVSLAPGSALPMQTTLRPGQRWDGAATPETSPAEPPPGALETNGDQK